MENITDIPFELIRQLRAVKRTFISDITTSIRRHGHFVGKGERRRQKHRKAISAKRQTFINFSPLAMSLGHGLAAPTIRSETQQREHVFRHPVPPTTQPNQLVSVFVIAMIKRIGQEELFVIQQIEHKSAPGFPGGGIEDGETILEAAAREFLEETRGKDGKAGVDIKRYNPIGIGKFTLNHAQNDEQGAVVLVILPENEKENIVAGGGDEEGETVKEVGFLTFGEVEKNLPNLLTNSRMAWKIFFDYLIS